MSEILGRLADTFDPGTIASKVALWLPNIIVAILILAAFWLFNRGLEKGAEVALRRTGIDQTAVTFIQSLVRYGLFTIAVITALGQLGVDISGLLTSLGVAGLTIGFAARDALSNVISGLFIFWDRPFVIGDLVEIGPTYGRVDTITMRSTRIVTPDGKMLAVPNTTIVNSTVASYTNFPHLRLDLDVTIGVNENIARVRALLLAAVEGEPEYLLEPTAKVVVTALNDYNIALQLRVWLQDETQHIAARMALREKIFVILTEAGVDMPCETLTLNPLQVTTH